MNQTPLTAAYTENMSSVLNKSAYTQSTANSALSKISTGAQTLPEGSRLSAKVLDFLGRDLTLKLPDGTVLHANSSTAVPLSIGQNAEFEVLRSTGELLLLKLVSETPQEASNSLAGRALAAAGLPVTEANTDLVNALLSNRMPVNAENLQSLAREANLFHTASPETLVMMHKHGMPVNNATIAQFQAYAGYEHELVPQLSQFTELLSSEGFTEALTEALTSEGMTGDAQFAEAETATTVEAPASQALSSGLPESGSSAVSESASSDFANPILQTSESASEAGNPAISPASESRSDITEAAVSSSAAGSSEEAASAQSKDVLPESDFMITKDGFINPESGEPISFSERWTLTPEQLQKPGELEKVYDRLHRDLTVLKSAIKKAREKNPDSDSPLGKTLSQAAETAGKLLDNLDFMNVLNRYFPYIQLPMRMEEKLTNGELYVYTKKGGGKQSSDPASVLLHLDMEQLGATDIFLSLAGNQLKTKFYLADEEIETLFKEHLEELTARIEKLGLTCNYEFLPQQEAEQPVHDFLTAPEAVSMKRYRFDRRA